MNRLQSSDPFLHRSVAGLLKPVGDIGEAAGMRIGRARRGGGREGGRARGGAGGAMR